MLGAITNTDDLKQWFLLNKKPFFTLKYENGGSTDRIILRNDTAEEMDDAWEMLQSQVVSQAASGRARLALIVYERGKHNNPSGYTMIDINPLAQRSTQGVASIAGLPAGIGSVTEYVDLKLATERLRWENDLLKEQLATPVNSVERWFETIGNLPGAMDVVKIIATGLVTKWTPEALPALQGLLNGLPAQIAESDEDHTAATGDAQQQFVQNIEQAANTLGVDPLTLSRKLAKLVTENPELAKSMI